MLYGIEEGKEVLGLKKVRSKFTLFRILGILLVDPYDKGVRFGKLIIGGLK